MSGRGEHVVRRAEDGSTCAAAGTAGGTGRGSCRRHRGSQAASWQARVFGMVKGQEPHRDAHDCAPCSSSIDGRQLMSTGTTVPGTPQIRLCLKAEEMRFGFEATEAMVCG